MFTALMLCPEKFLTFSQLLNPGQLKSKLFQKSFAPLGRYFTFYTKNPSPRAALLSILGGGITRLVTEITLPKDGSLLLPFVKSATVHEIVGPSMEGAKILIPLPVMLLLVIFFLSIVRVLTVLAKQLLFDFSFRFGFRFRLRFGFQFAVCL